MKRVNDNDIDPIAIELILSILSTTASILGTIFQFGALFKKTDGLRNDAHALRRQLMRLHNSLDDLILTIQRHDHQRKEDRISSKALTSSGTVMFLERRDYWRWIDLQYEIQKLSQETFVIISSIRERFAEAQGGVSDSEAVELFRSFDELFLNWSNYTVGEFVGKFRQALTDLDSQLVKMSEKP